MKSLCKDCLVGSFWCPMKKVSNKKVKYIVTECTEREDHIKKNKKFDEK